MPLPDDGGVVDRVVRELAYGRPAQWFRFLDNRVNLGCPDEAQRGHLCELKAARDALEHNRGVVGPDYLDKAGDFARYAVGDAIQIDEPYLLGCFVIAAGGRRGDGRGGDPAIIRLVGTLISTDRLFDPEQDELGRPAFGRRRNYGMEHRPALLRHRNRLLFGHIRVHPRPIRLNAPS